jgi:hypothetical protein
MTFDLDLYVIHQARRQGMAAHRVGHGEMGILIAIAALQDAV